ncbi:MAG TPA: hypothetical protein VNT57_00745 [Desulfobacteria bacterium]|nr:hypothetical protein [Desulfobacteria bacterium]
MEASTERCTAVEDNALLLVNPGGDDDGLDTIAGNNRIESF